MCAEEHYVRKELIFIQYRTEHWIVLRVNEQSPLRVTCVKFKVIMRLVRKDLGIEKQLPTSQLMKFWVLSK